MKALKAFLPKVGLLVVSISLTLVLLEVGLRFVARGVVNLDLLYGEYDPMLGSRNKRNLDTTVPFPDRPNGFHFVTNSQGLREESDIPLEKPAGQQRILVLGDSHTSGLVEIPDTYPGVLEELLRAQGADIEVINAGTGAYSPLQELLWYHLYGQAFQPDVVVLGVYLGNDLADLGIEPVQSVELGTDGTIRINGIVKEPTSQTLQDRLQRIYLYNLVANFVNKTGSPEGSTAEREAAAVCGGCYWQHLWQVKALADNPARLETGLASMKTILETLKSQVETSGAKLVVVLIPSRAQVEQPLSDQPTLDSIAILGLTQEDIQVEEEIATRLENVCQQLEIPVISLVEPLRENFQVNQQPLYYPKDWHLNERGNRIVGETLALEITPILKLLGSPH